MNRETTAEKRSRIDRQYAVMIANEATRRHPRPGPSDFALRVSAR